MQSILFVLLICCSLLITACGGGGGSSSSTQTEYGFDITDALQSITLTDAGTWHTKPDAEANGNGTLALYAKSLLKVNNDEQYSLAMVGWSYQGFDTTLEIPPTINMALFTPNEDGTLYLNTDSYIDDPVTNGGANVIIADYNEDGRDDILLPAANESPFVGRESTAYITNESGTFDKVRWGDDLLAHGANLVYIDGEPVVYTATFIDGQSNPIITYENGEFKTTELTNIQDGMDRILLFDSITNTQKLLSAQHCRNYDDQAQSFERCGVGVFNMNGYDAASKEPVQEITTWLTSIDEYREYGISVGYDGGSSHNFTIMSDDLNNDGRDDAMLLTTMWNMVDDNYPSKVDVILASADGFTNETEKLNPDIPVTADIGDHQPIQYDIDNSGIDTYFFSGSSWLSEASNFDEHLRNGNYVTLNDGTGRLYVGLHDEFYRMSDYIKNYLDFYGYDVMPAFIAIPQEEDGAINFLAEFRDGTGEETVYKFVNVPIRWNPTIHFSQNITINDRNNSKRLRTWAGDDVIYDTNANSPAHIDGGFGTNKCIYSGLSAEYTVTENPDGSSNVVSNDNTINDTLVNIQTLVFLDKELELN